MNNIKPQPTGLNWILDSAIGYATLSNVLYFIIFMCLIIVLYMSHIINNSQIPYFGMLGFLSLIIVGLINYSFYTWELIDVDIQRKPVEGFIRMRHQSCEDRIGCGIPHVETDGENRNQFINGERKMSCQEISDNYGAFPGSYADIITQDDKTRANLTNQWESMKCETVPYTWTCQVISDTYGTRHGALEAAVKVKGARELWDALGCNTIPSDWTCQQMSNGYGVYPGTFNSGATFDLEDLKNAWINKSCQTSPQNYR
jgi:hypothetical protein